MTLFPACELRSPKPTGLSGTDGLLLSVIARAVQDYLRGEPRHVADAYDYFIGAVYLKHLDMLDFDLPQHWLPAALEAGNNDT